METENAQVTEDIATKTAQQGQHGGEAAAETVIAIRNIATQITVTEDISYQTNLLALNATI
ncbi:hypothetical protein [Psychromonas hadalis]|uniref:hypothetical protein n=1 Tax=Psychromonas hadalis TaxID=211669 RepID=UPI0003B33840|nr:hypothetical protein [Psychromonas hadalis]